MLIRKDECGVVAIGQQSHAWLSGQLARAWGNERFGAVEPYEEVCVAAEQHDVGWGDRDQDPPLSADTGLPESFMEVPLIPHLELFTEGPKRLITQSRYAALLVSMHGWRLYQRRGRDADASADATASADRAASTDADAAAIRRFLVGQEEFQAELRAVLRDDPATSPQVDDPVVHRNSMLIWTWDYLSLALCLGWAPASAKRCPTADGAVDLELAEGAGCFHLEPWPFRAQSVTVHCEGRRLAERRFADQGAMREALAQAPWETLRFELRPR